MAVESGRSSVVAQVAVPSPVVGPGKGRFVRSSSDEGLDRWAVRRQSVAFPILICPSF